MYPSPSYHDSKPRLQIDPNRLWPGLTNPSSSMGGWAMSRNYSDRSNASSQSQSPDAYYSPLSRSPSMSYDSNSPQSSQYFEGSYTPTYENYTAAPVGLERRGSSQTGPLKATPSSLGWTPGTELLKLYKFVVPKGKEPYLELLPGLTVYNDTPSQVYLDSPSNPQKGVYPCQYPVPCPGRNFGRPADLERHYRHVHADMDQKSSFCCDYKPCTRHTDPFTRKDHYRDHLKDFHKEDVGSAKQGKNTKDSKKRQAIQDAWLEERQMDLRWFRCKKCLQRVNVETYGYKCATCNEDCAPERIAERRKRAQAKENSRYTDPILNCSSTVCAQCNGSMWVTDVFGTGGTPCPFCISSTEDYEPGWNNTQFDSTYTTPY